MTSSRSPDVAAIITLSLLGTPVVRRRTGRRAEILRLPPKPLALLAYLVLLEQPEGCRRDCLLALLWPELDDRRARGALRQALLVLRRTIGPDLLLTPGEEVVRLNRELMETDAHAFLGLVAEGTCDDAVRLYGGPLLNGLLVKDAPEFMEWLEQCRDGFRNRFARCLEDLAEGCEERREWQDAAGWWSRRLALDRFNVRAAVALVRCQAAAGDPAGALRWAECFATLLRRETGVDPAPQLQEAFAEGCRLVRWQSVPLGRTSGSPVAPGPGGVAVGRVSRESAVLLLLSLALLAAAVLR